MCRRGKEEEHQRMVITNQLQTVGKNVIAQLSARDTRDLLKNQVSLSGAG